MVAVGTLAFWTVVIAVVLSTWAPPGGVRAVVASPPGVRAPASATSTSATSTSTSATGTWLLVNVVDGDTVNVTRDGSAEKIRLLGIDAPEIGQCGHEEATARLEAILADGVSVTFDDGQDQDRYGRLLAFLSGADGADAGLTLIEAGLTIARYDSRDGYRRHARQDEYIAADAASPNYSCSTTPAPTSTRGSSTGDSPTTTSAPPPVPSAPPPVPGTPPPVPSAPPPVPPGNCDPSYPTVCIPSSPPDLDCADIPYRRFVVLAPDPHRFDGGGDGIGCEGA